MQPFSQHDTWRKRLEVDVAAKEAELQALKDARDVDRRLLGINHQWTSARAGNLSVCPPLSSSLLSDVDKPTAWLGMAVVERWFFQYRIQYIAMHLGYSLFPACWDDISSTWIRTAVLVVCVKRSSKHLRASPLDHVDPLTSKSCLHNEPINSVRGHFPHLVRHLLSPVSNSVRPGRKVAWRA